MSGTPIPKILIIDDDAQTLELLVMLLVPAGFQVISASGGAEGLRKLYQERPHLILLDVAMPQMNGWQTYTYIRELTELPVIFLGSAQNAREIVHALELGAVDFITKPMQPEIVVARVKAALRTAAPAAVEPADLYHHNALTIDPAQKRVWVRGREIGLTTYERRLFFYLFQQAGTLCTFEQLLTQVWGSEYRESTQYVHVYISRLRQKIEVNSKHPQYILTEYGKGYWFQKLPPN